MKAFFSLLAGHLAVLAVNIIFGFNSPTAKLIVPEWISPTLFTLARISFATLLFWVVGLFMPHEKVSWKDKGIICIGGVFGLVGVMYSFAEALCYTSPVDITLIAALAPVFVMLLAALFLKEPITLRKAAGVFIGMAGVLTLILPKILAEGIGNMSLKGDLLCFVNIISYAIYLISTRKVTQKYSTITLMKWMFLSSWLFTLPLCIGESITSVPMWCHGMQWIPFLRLSFIAVAATGLAYFLIPVGLKRLRPTTVSMYNNLQPLIASCIAIYWGQDQFGWNKVFAALLVFTGVWLVTRSRKKEKE